MHTFVVVVSDVSVEVAVVVVEKVVVVVAVVFQVVLSSRSCDLTYNSM